VTIIDLEVMDLRFPTARAAIGSDAMHPDPDYSAAYVILKTDGAHEGHGLTFTIGRGTEICVAAIQAFRHHVVGWRLDDLTADLGAFWRRLANDSQLCWLGPEKGVIHLSMAAIVNAVWDLYAKTEGKPVWKLLADMTPSQIVRCIDFRYISDALTPEEAVALLEAAPDERRARASLAAERISRVHDISRMDRIFRRTHWRCVPRCIGRRLDALQGEGGRHPRGRLQARGARARGHRARAHADDRRQSAMGGRRSDRTRARAGRVQPAVDRRTDQP
jgi:L-alanine-DL-glutamate epimerase-like enolase superfamily enzyme